MLPGRLYAEALPLYCILWDLLVILAVLGLGGPTWMALVLPLRCAAVGSVDDVPATSVRVRVLVHNGALLRVSCKTPFGRCLVVRTFSFPKVLWNSCRQNPTAPSSHKKDSASWVS